MCSSCQYHNLYWPWTHTSVSSPLLSLRSVIGILLCEWMPMGSTFWLIRHKHSVTLGITCRTRWTPGVLPEKHCGSQGETELRVCAQNRWHPQSSMTGDANWLFQGWRGKGCYRGETHEISQLWRIDVPQHTQTHTESGTGNNCENNEDKLLPEEPRC